MLKKIIGYLFLLLPLAGVRAQDSVRNRLIFIGDAGEINPHQSAVITTAAAQILDNKTTVLFLGDNIYPDGMPLKDPAAITAAEKILTAQYEPMLKNGAKVVFVPGNHDWDRMGKQGYKKILAQDAFLNGQNNPRLKLLPEKGCPGPEEIPVSEEVVLIAFDSEWWLFQHEKNSEACECSTKEAFLEKLSEIVNRNRGKMIFLVCHHPFQSYGVHGGYYNLKDHIFPLTNLNKGLYIPLPVIGSLYPLLRSSIPNPEDQGHPDYKEMTALIDSVFNGYQNLVHVAGHEHGLQFIKGQQTQIVSGAGAKNAYVKKGRHSLFARKNSGFVTVDVLTGAQLKITYYMMDGGRMQQAFEYRLPFITGQQQREAVSNDSLATADSVVVRTNAALEKPGRGHRVWFGENFRKEWAAPEKLPVLRISEISGGLTPIKEGGGLQTKSLRLASPSGKEWVLRNVNKNMEILLPEALRNTFAKDAVTDALSGQHPFSALIVPPIANAVGVPHANPIIGVVAPDTALLPYADNFFNKVCLLEEREPIGKSDNTEKMYKNLLKDNDNTVDTATYFRARLVDLLIGDWDRHEDQWRWAYDKKKKDRRYVPVPRDRDQVFHVVQGILPTIASGPSIMPRFHDFTGKIKKINAYFMAGRAINGNFFNQYNYDQWMQLVHDFTTAVTDSVLEAALKRLPAASYNRDHDKFLAILKERRNRLPEAMTTYYRFYNRVVDIQTSDKKELVQITDAGDRGLKISIHKINKEDAVSDQLFERTFDAGVTKEIRLYIHSGDDSAIINTRSKIRLRIIGDKDKKQYQVVNGRKNIRVYGKKEQVYFTGEDQHIRKRLSNDSSNTAYMPTDLYNRYFIRPNLGFNRDDGIMLGLGVRFVNQGFRKKPYANSHQLSYLHSFSSGANSFRFKSDWLHAIGNADLVVIGRVLAPDNVQNFFGLGNGTGYDKSKGVGYYRARFTLVDIAPGLRWRFKKTRTLSVSPFFQHYRYDADDNEGKLIATPSLVGTYDSITVNKNKNYTGLVFNYEADSRDDQLLPTSGGLLNLRLQGFKGLNSSARDFAQLLLELSFFRKVGASGNVVFSDRIGGGTTVGNAPFYQVLFLGGQENLLGYRKFRFAGEHLLYNNLQLRIKIADVGSYILPGQLGFSGFFDAGKVWAEGYNSPKIHTGVGGGLYFVPAQIAVVQLLAGYSREGWYPHFSVGFRF
ncbi:BamA/TamA family outer membrane protein [Niabella beijingensis]|uniref:BamA/TamA family outer membrane protein n=1 Tax=Niabella beijingensis TaxID=2872700 RepID=UPI001CBBE114|nr:BamA/TamA family outer membrane protein [Niabella beijingensis]MBZ4189246.1 BamA/TamA family outer membrane protein [Niabella beijingensis]